MQRINKHKIKHASFSHGWSIFYPVLFYYNYLDNNYDSPGSKCGGGIGGKESLVSMPLLTLPVEFLFHL